MTDAKTMTARAGGVWRNGLGLAACPICQPEGRKDQVALNIRQGLSRVLVKCHKTDCDWREIKDALGGDKPPLAPQRNRVAINADEKAEREKKLRTCASIWANTKPISGTKGEAYLRGRGITCDLPESLRWAHDCYHSPSGQRVSAMVGKVSTGAIHRTFFDKQGNRLPRSAKMMLGPCSGAHISLSETTGPLVVTEGIETGLSLRSGLLSEPATVWAALSAIGIRGLSLPVERGRLIIAPDGDQAGLEAAEVLATKANAKGWQVDLMKPPLGQDWNDVLVQRGAAA